MVERMLMLALVAAVWFHGDYHGVTAERLAWTNKVNEATEQARETEQRRQGLINDSLQKQYDDQMVINSDLLGDLNELRSRPPRHSASTDPRPTCEGATGRELSGPDAGFLRREAARADTLRTALAACYRYADALRP